MKKIILTMFKCSAICVTTTIALGEKERSVEDRLGLSSSHQLINMVSRKSGYIKETLIPITKEQKLYRSVLKRICSIALYPETFNARKLLSRFYNSKTHTWKPLYNRETQTWDGTFMQCLNDRHASKILHRFYQSTLQDPEVFNEQKNYYLLSLLAEQIIKSNFYGCSLYPNDILIHIRDNEQPSFSDFLDTPREASELYGDTYNKMQVRNNINQPFAFLMLYTLMPDLHPYFISNRISVRQGKIVLLSEDCKRRGFLENLPGKDTLVIKLATGLYNGAISMENILEFLKRPGDYTSIIDSLEDSIEQINIEERTRARLAVMHYGLGEFHPLLCVTHPDLLSVAIVLSKLEEAPSEIRGPIPTDIARFLSDMCDTASPEQCLKSGKIRVSTSVKNMIDESLPQPSNG